MRQRVWTIAGILSGLLACGCAAPVPPVTMRWLAQGVGAGEQAPPAADGQPVELRGGRNETLDFVLEIDPLPPANRWPDLSLRMGPLLQSGVAAHGPTNTIGGESLSAYQVLPMPINTNHAGFVRHTGLPASMQQLPRALLPLPGRDGQVSLNRLRDPAAAIDPRSSAAGKRVALWIDLHVPPLTVPGTYRGRAELLVGGQVAAAIELALRVDDFVLPDQPSLLMVSDLPWGDLERLFPDRFEAKTPELVNRKDGRYEAVVKTLDQMVLLAQRHRAVVTVSRLAPIVKWGFNREDPPQCSWDYFDSVVSPWLIGDAFANRIPLGFWPLPRTAQQDRLDPAAQKMYWRTIAGHFDQMDWLPRTAAVFDVRGRTTPAAALQLSADAATVLQSHPRIVVALDALEDQLPLRQPGVPNLLDATELDRVYVAAPGLVTGPAPPRARDGGLRWLRTDAEGLVPYVGAGADERETRLWAWLAFLRDAQMIRWRSPLPSRSSAAAPADPDELVWFYPGAWFGLDEPVPSVQIKWLRRAEQDYEYLLQAKKRGQVVQARVMARLLAKPVEIGAQQAPDPSYALMCGTNDPRVWSEAMELLSRVIQMRRPGQPLDPEEEARVGNAILAWMTPQERPMLLGRRTEWGFAAAPGAGKLDRNTLDLRLHVDVYNAADTRPARNRLEWAGVPPAWQFTPHPVLVPQLLMFHVTGVPIEAKVRLDRLAQPQLETADITFVNGEDKREMLLRCRLPVGLCEQREGQAPAVDGSLEEWAPPDCVHNGRLVRMLSRPTIQKQELSLASTRSELYTTWTARDVFLAFRLEGVQPPRGTGGSATVDSYQFRRAWGEDLAEVLIQPVYADNTAGPVVHVICRPAGQIEVRRRFDPRMHADPLVPVTGADVRYSATVNAPPGAPAGPSNLIWRGELALPWSIFTEPGAARPRPALLRFNFVQHRNADGESASWAGPVDFGRDSGFTGLLHVREVGAR